MIKPNLSYHPVLHLALQQNEVPVIRSLTIENTSHANLENLSLKIWVEPDFADPWEIPIDSIPAGARIEWSQIDMKWKPARLMDLTERMAAHLIIQVTKGEEVLCSHRYPLDILAYDQWHGLGILPEMLVAFITPNHREISSILVRASHFLETWTGNPSFDGYQSLDPDRVRKQMAAIYEAIVELEILYCPAPASFESQGQRVRLVDTVLSQRIGNCLDMSLLYAACLEAVDIRPLIVMVEGHAFVGGWLIEEDFPDAVNDEPTLLTKRMAEGIHEITLVEATAMNKGTAQSFDEAVRMGHRKMGDGTPFHLFIDVHRARTTRIRPLPLSMDRLDGKLEPVDPETRRNIGVPQPLGQIITAAEKKEESWDRPQMWSRKLLDLTLRNSLLNMRMRKNVIHFPGVNPAKLEDALAMGEGIKLFPRAQDWDSSARSESQYQAKHHGDPIVELAKEELAKKRLRSYDNKADLDSKLKGLYRAARTSIEENGANTLYLAMGLLKWFESDQATMPRLAPILLLPVRLDRYTARSEYVLKTTEEEPLLNVTLLEKLRQDFDLEIAGLDKLPEDDNGVDVEAVFAHVRRAIMGRARWDVEDSVYLSIFSFSKFILWNDIRNNRDHILSHKVVDSLVQHQLQWLEEPEEQRDLDQAIHPSSLPLPIATDSSQLEAILSSMEGKSFVLHGPPGTGKSQTITNMIAAALYQNKRVLFVASKKAALEVVQKRLESIGLGSFCLELHSNKATKSSVLEQLEKATQVTGPQTPNYFQQRADRLLQLRQELNAYVDALHKVWPVGLSLYDAIVGFSELADQELSVRLPSSVMANISRDQRQVWEHLVSEMEVILKQVGRPIDHPLAGIKLKEYTPQLRDEIQKSLASYLADLEHLDAGWKSYLSTLLLEDRKAYRSNPEKLHALVEELLPLPDLPVTLFNLRSPKQDLENVHELIARGRKLQSKKEVLLRQFRPGVLQLDGEALYHAWNIAEQKWFLPRYLGQRKLRTTLRAYALPGAWQEESLPESLQILMDYQKEKQAVESAEEVASWMGWLWKGADSDWDAWEAAIEKVGKTLTTITTLLGPKESARWRSQLADSFPEGTGQFIQMHEQGWRQRIEQWKAAEAKEKELVSLVGADLFRREGEAEWPKVQIEQLQKVLAHWDRLRNWTIWTGIRDRALDQGMEILVEAAESGLPDLRLQYEKALYKAVAEHAMSEFPSLNRFNSDLFEHKVSEFQQISHEFERQSQEELFARLASRVPNFTQEAHRNSEVGILLRAIRSRGRGLSIRNLFDSISTLLPRLTPCMLMSPLSVAQYFDPQKTSFDMVIFDEASQMPTFEAVGAIARGKSLIVVGDPKQMPPTSFFTSSHQDEESITEDLESILDDCLALSMPSRYLRWHYRSRHESLIAFSNAKYYENRLFTFPSIDDMASKVSLERVNGHYDIGKTRQNRVEAKAIVDEIERRLKDPENSGRSLGVVTFSSVQQNLIEDLLSDRFREDPDLERRAMEAEEPLFIKNLENVQGDERDIILFSVCYGPDENGKISLNFGPLNREGGWRRLNVAVTRARYEMKVFSSFYADAIDLSRTRSEGVAGLKAFLAFAQKGKSALPIPSDVDIAEPSGMERQLAEALKEKGYEVQLAVGCSGYRIDIGVVNPKEAHTYILGILCDGPRYRNAKTARDRAVVQEGVLKSLHWNIHRVWSLDWWEKPEKVIEEVIQAMEGAKSKKSQASPKAEEYAEMKSSMETPERGQEELAHHSRPIFNAAPRIPVVSAPRPRQASRQVYKSANLKFVDPYLSLDFYRESNRSLILDQIKRVLELESPISLSLLYRRLTHSWVLSRAGSRFREYIEEFLSEISLRRTSYEEREFLWKNTQHPDNYWIYRVPESELDKRDVEDIPPEEIAMAMYDVLHKQVGLPKEDLMKEAAQEFGFSRMGTKVEKCMALGLAFLMEKGKAREERGRMILNEDPIFGGN